MRRLILRRLAHMVLVLLVVSFGLTFLIDLTPGDPAYLVLGEFATPEQVDNFHEELNLDDPPLSRYGRWLGSALQGDLGQSYVTREPVRDMLARALPTTFEIVALTIVISLLVSIPIGVFTAYRRDSVLDRYWMIVSSVLISMPGFVIALGLVYVFALRMQDFAFALPVTGWVSLGDSVGENIRHLVLPVATLSLLLIPQYALLLRADMIATLQEDFVLAAHAKGVPRRRILLRHALRPSLFSLVTVAAINIGNLIGGAVIVETLFAIPGLGLLTINSILNKDIVAVQGIVMFTALVYVILNMAVDVLYRLLDPRVRVRQQAS